MRSAAVGLAVLVLTLVSPAWSQHDRETCLSCHEDETLTGTSAAGEQVSVQVDRKGLSASVHAGLECVDCHLDLSGIEDYPHADSLGAVSCGRCHDGVADLLARGVHGPSVAGGQPRAPCSGCHGSHDIKPPGRVGPGQDPVRCGLCHQQIARLCDLSLHGQAVRAGAELAPRCWDCHGGHDIVGPEDPRSRVTKFNIPFMCGTCHKEGAPVDQRYAIPQDSILEHYSESIHGLGLYKQGLTVTAACADCHTAHNVRSHTDPESSIHRDNVARTCQQCHGQIEQVHRKVIRGELWEKEPHRVPVCVDCHSPHEIRRVLYDEGISDRECLRCHADPKLTVVRDGQTVSLHLDTLETRSSQHRGTACAQCHTGATPGPGRPCATVAERVDCSVCHSEVVATYATSTHGKLVDRGDPDAPACTDCHGTHHVQGRKETASPTFPTNVPQLCAQCHRRDAKAAVRRHNDERVEQYAMSIHGKGLLSSGLVVTAMCTDCHTAHHVLPPEDPGSSVNPTNIPTTCAKCHNGVYEQYRKSSHSPEVSTSDRPLPTCSGCHLSHSIRRADQDSFRLTVREQCGACHRDVTESYFGTVHGKAARLGSAAAAQCHDCHGAHDITPPSDPGSRLSRANIVGTCGRCHEGSHRQFAGYLTHATHHDRSKYPVLFYTFWFMTTLLVTTLVVAGVHTLLWLPRSFQMMKQHRQLRSSLQGRLEYRRFKPLHSRLHIMVIISFLGLAITGMALKFSYLRWAQVVADLLGGSESAGYIHRVCAIITFLYFGLHLHDLFREKRRRRQSLREMLFSANSMLPNWNDWHDLKATFMWFIGRGPRPRYGRWTYWEKFDYFAVFWGVAVIGSTGLMLWFPEFFTRFLPGWIINVAAIVHSDEALLAVAFIFTIHFFNTHFRPDKFPMDTVIFTGRVPLEELKQDRPREYEELLKTRRIKDHLVEPLPPLVVRAARIFGAVALTIGLSLILLIIYAEVFGYR